MPLRANAPPPPLHVRGRTSCYALDNMAAEKGSCIATLVLLAIILVLFAPMDGSFVVPHKYPLCK